MAPEKSKKQLHFTLFTFPPFVHHYPDGWRHPQEMLGGIYDPLGPDIWARVARTLESMKIDAFFVGDGGAIYNSNENSPATSLRYGSQTIEFFAPQFASMVATLAPDLGVVSTVNTEELNPWTMARMASTMDHLTKGRVGFNLVTGLNPGGMADNLGTEVREHDARYERAEEFMKVCYSLWESWDTGALVRDPDQPLFADPDKVHEINFVGEHFRCRGPLQLPRSPQTIPVLFQAGQSPRGRQFAARHAEGIFTISPDLPAMQAYYRDVKDRVANEGRRECDLAILSGIFPIVGSSEAAAKEKYEQLIELATAEAGLAWCSGYACYNFAQVPFDTKLSDLDPKDFAGIQSIFELTMASSADAASQTPYLHAYPHVEEPTVRDLCVANAQSIVPKVVGTVAQVADQLEQIVDSEGSDGFMFSTVHMPGSIDEFAPVIAELQRRGRFRIEFEGPTLRERLGTRPYPWAHRT
jgi:FMN-dependent oxidoreductase (nitrilotriacetate monooxygenase family)